MGAHTSIQGGVNAAIPLAEKLGFTAMQIFTKNNNRWSAPPLKEEEAAAFREGIAKSGIRFVMAHDSYLINLGAPSDEAFQKSVDAMVDELERCEMLGIPQLNFHPGAHLGEGEEFGIRRIAQALDIIHTPGTPWFDLIEQVDCPILLITGEPELGALVTPDFAKELAGRWRQGQIVHIDGVGHSIRRGQPARYAQAVCEFLAVYHTPRA